MFAGGANGVMTDSAKHSPVNLPRVARRAIGIKGARGKESGPGNPLPAGWIDEPAGHKLPPGIPVVPNVHEDAGVRKPSQPIAAMRSRAEQVGILGQVDLWIAHSLTNNGSSKYERAAMDITHKHPLMEAAARGPKLTA